MPSRERTTFTNREGHELATAVELPDGEPRGFVLFAHCFSCGKDISAATRIARALTALGFGVMRFDFTGLGKSEGDFGNAGFSSNVHDLIDAADWLRDQHSAPAVLMGHSLGGTAVLAAADSVAECRAVVTIGSPSAPSHVIKQFADKRAEIEASGKAEVDLAGRPFTISSGFIEDLERQELAPRIGKLRRALLVFHAPLDPVVSVDEASKIFAAAKHPKSYISLDGADHLLTNTADAQYVAATTAAWLERYLPDEEQTRPSVEKGQVVVTEQNQKFLRGMFSDDHSWVADEPKAMGGDNLGPDPYEHLLAALGACTSMTIRMYANHKKLALDDLTVTLRHFREHAEDCEGCEDKAHQIDVIEREIELVGDLSDSEHARLMQIADRCPVHRTLEGDLAIRTQAAG